MRVLQSSETILFVMLFGSLLGALLCLQTGPGRHLRWVHPRPACKVVQEMDTWAGDSVQNPKIVGDNLHFRDFIASIDAHRKTRAKANKRMKCHGLQPAWRSKLCNDKPLH